ncbi:MAG: efflux RND transporter periplasmic adaptor subunit [Deltaproteobacteria bacterium]|nr:efflux RND transporter periplasmic adaptor subunit [Deltaproteobacteria bacterium]
MKPLKVIIFGLTITTACLCIQNLQSFAQAPPPAPVVVDKVQEETLQKPITLVGTVEPNKRSIIASEIEGLVESLPGKEGKFVNKGEVIAKFNTRTIEIDLNEAKAGKREAQARYQLAKQNLTRFQELESKGVASIQQLQGSESEKSAWAARISQFQAQVDGLEYDIEKSNITAPFSGYVTEEYTEVGQWVQKGGQVVELIDIEIAEINIDMPERYISKVKTGLSVNVNFDALPDLELKGKITSLVPQADRESRTFPVKINIDNKDGTIKSGMVARVSFPIGEPSTVKLVPKDAIVSQNNANFIYIVNEGAAQPLPVSTGMAFEDKIQVIGPVQTGQLVVVKGNERLMPNQPVKILNEEINQNEKAN